MIKDTNNPRYYSGYDSKRKSLYYKRGRYIKQTGGIKAPKVSIYEYD